MTTEIKVFVAFLGMSGLTLVGYVAGIFVDTQLYGLMEHSAFSLSVISLSCSLWVAWLAYGIRSYNESTLSLDFLLEFVDTHMSAHALKHRDGEISFSM